MQQPLLVCLHHLLSPPQLEQQLHDLLEGLEAPVWQQGQA